MNKILWLDLETTGLNENENHIVQIGAIVDHKGEEIDRFNTLIKPPFLPFDYNIGAGNATSLTKEMLDANGDSPSQAFDDFTQFLGKHIKPNSKKNKFFLAGKNINFDRKFLEVFFDNFDDQLIRYIYPLVIDIDSLICKAVIEEKMKPDNFRLGTVANALGIELIGAHDAMNDIMATKNIYYKLIK